MCEDSKRLLCGEKGRRLSTGQMWAQSNTQTIFDEVCSEHSRFMAFWRAPRQLNLPGICISLNNRCRDIFAIVGASGVKIVDIIWNIINGRQT